MVERSCRKNISVFQRMQSKVIMTSSKILFYICVSFVAGVGMGSFFRIPQFILWIFLIIAVLMVVFFAIAKNTTILPVAAFCLFFLILGILRFQIAEFNIKNDKLSRLNDSGEVVTLTGTIVEEPDVRESSQKIKVKTYEFDSVILLTTSRYPEYKYLDKVRIIGNLQTPMETEEFSYKNYLLKDHIYSVMYFSKLELVGKDSGGPFSDIYSGILWLKNKMRKSIQANLLPPHSSILQGVILGDKSAISQSIKDKFKITGLSHIIAISGMHVVILSTIIMYFLLSFGLWRNQAFYGAVAFIFVYVLLVGMPSSAVRAGIMAVIYLLGQKLGRQTMSTRIIVLAGALMLLFNPLLLFYDVGFQLSFLAVLGIILLEPIIKSFIKVKEEYRNVLSLFTVTISAQIFTLPIIIYNFGNVSFVSLFTNVLILPAIQGVMLFGFLSAFLGTFLGAIGWLMSLPCYFLLSYVFWVVDVFSKPWAYKVVSNIHWIWPVLPYIFLGVLIKYFNKRLRANFLDY